MRQRMEIKFTDETGFVPDITERDPDSSPIQTISKRTEAPPRTILIILPDGKVVRQRELDVEKREGLSHLKPRPSAIEVKFFDGFAARTPTVRSVAFCPNTTPPPLTSNHGCEY